MCKLYVGSWARKMAPQPSKHSTAQSWPATGRQELRDYLFAQAQLLVLISTFIVMLAPQAIAIPPFARRYNTSCITCHTLVPKLNPYGIAFRNNGYRIPDYDRDNLRDSDVVLGAPAWKDVWPKGVWPSAIPKDVPLGIRIQNEASYTPNAPVHLNADFPSTIYGYLGGNTGDTISYFGRIQVSATTGVVSVDRAFLQIRLTPELAGSNPLVLRLGKLDTKAAPFSIRTRNTTTEIPLAISYKTFSDSFSFNERDSGVELWGALTGLDNHGGLEYAVGLTQGSFGKAENNNFKDKYWSFTYKVGGLGVAGSRSKENIPLTETSYKETALHLGAYGYHGKVPLPQFGNREMNYRRTGLRLDANYRTLNIFGTYLWGLDKIPSRSLVASSNAFFIQADYMLLPWVMTVARFDSALYYGLKQDVRSTTIGVNIAIRANVLLRSEETIYHTIPQRTKASFRLEVLF